MVLQLQIENINVCNAKCVFCPYPEQKRKHCVMPLTLFKKIIDDAATTPLFERLTITGLGEPTLDPGLIEKIQYARKTLHPKTEIDCYTNGSKLTEEYVNNLEKAGLSVQHWSPSLKVWRYETESFP